MKYLQLLLLCSVLLFACTEPQTANQSNTSAVAEDNSNLPSLNGGQSAQIKKIHQTFQEVYPISLEETTTNFRRDKNTDEKIKTWNHMAEIYQDFAVKHAGKDQLAIRKDAFRLLLLRSALSKDDAIKRLKSKQLSEEKARKLLSKYTL